MEMKDVHGVRMACSVCRQACSLDQPLGCWEEYRQNSFGSGVGSGGEKVLLLIGRDIAQSD